MMLSGHHKNTAPTPQCVKVYPQFLVIFCSLLTPDLALRGVLSELTSQLCSEPILATVRRTNLRPGIIFSMLDSFSPSDIPGIFREVQREKR